MRPGPKDNPRTIDEGGLDDVYQFEQLHFHWGSDSKKGSEHLIDGQAFPLEVNNLLSENISKYHVLFNINSIHNLISILTSETEI